MLKREGIIHSVLQPKYHQQEAEIVARAGQRAPSPLLPTWPAAGLHQLAAGVRTSGGLHVIGTERHEARRIDDNCVPLRAPGRPRLLPLFHIPRGRSHAPVRLRTAIVKYMEKMGSRKIRKLEHPLLTAPSGRLKKRVEQHNFQIRKRTLEYDDVMNKTARSHLCFRNEIIHAADVGIA